MLAEDKVMAIASAVTPWKRACAGQRLLKMCESFQSAARGAAAVIPLARVSRPLPSMRPPCPANAWDMCPSDRLDAPAATLLGPPVRALRQGQDCYTPRLAPLLAPGHARSCRCGRAAGKVMTCRVEESGGRLAG